jgi:hypothetical protein
LLILEKGFDMNDFFPWIALVAVVLLISSPLLSSLYRDKQKQLHFKENLKASLKQYNYSFIRELTRSGISNPDHMIGKKIAEVERNGTILKIATINGIKDIDYGDREHPEDGYVQFTALDSDGNEFSPTLFLVGRELDPSHSRIYEIEEII